MKKITQMGLLSALGVVIYTSAVVELMNNAERIFGSMQGFVGPLSFLLLIVLSVAIVGTLIFAKPILMYIDNAKKEAIKLLLYTLGWLFLATIIALVIQIWI